MPVFSGSDFSKELECAICLDAWDDPIELAPCKHVFCRKCVASLSHCAECRQKITSRNAPNRILINMAEDVSVRCSECHWVGKRSESRRHKCGDGSRSVAVPQHSQQAFPQRPHPHHEASPPAFPDVIPVQDDKPWIPYGLSQVEYDQIFSIFLTFDADNSGELDFQELKRLARWLNFAHTDADIASMFQQMDRDHNGTLSLAEFCTWLKYNRPDPNSLYGMTQMEYNYILMQFHSYDDDASGELTLHQFTRLCLSCGYARTPAEANDIFRRIDLDNGGTIDLHEFLTYRTRTRGGAAPALHSSSAASYAAPAPGAASYNSPPSVGGRDRSQTMPMHSSSYQYYQQQPQPVQSGYGTYYPPHPQQQQQQQQYRTASIPPYHQGGASSGYPQQPNYNNQQGWQHYPPQNDRSW